MACEGDRLFALSQPISEPRRHSNEYRWKKLRGGQLLMDDGCLFMVLPLPQMQNQLHTILNIKACLTDRSMTLSGDRMCIGVFSQQHLEQVCFHRLLSWDMSMAQSNEIAIHLVLNCICGNLLLHTVFEAPSTVFPGPPGRSR